MTDKPENPQAYPTKTFVSYGHGAGEWETTGGMTLRDYFAGQALAGRLAHPDNDVTRPTNDADWAYEYADAMLEERLNDT